MRSLLEFREKIKLIYSKNEVFIFPLFKFLLAFITLSITNGTLGYMDRIDNIAIVLILSLMCSFLPTGAITLFNALFSILHVYSLSMEAAIVVLGIYLIMFLLFFRFGAKGTLAVLLTPLLFVLKIPYIIPIAVGLLAAPYAAVFVGCGVVVYYLLDNIAQNANTLNSLGGSEITAIIRLVIDGLLNNKEMLVVTVSFVVTTLVVYLIRRLSIDHAWTIAMVSGVMLNLVLLLIGDLLYETDMGLLNGLLGSVLALGVAKVLEFSRFCVDYTRTEKVQFEDDEYYYYVKAIPKMSVAAQTKTVKRIHTPSPELSRQGNADQHRSEPNRERRVVTERTGMGKGGAQGQSRNYRGDRMNSGKSVTVGSSSITEEEEI